MSVTEPANQVAESQTPKSNNDPDDIQGDIHASKDEKGQYQKDNENVNHGRTSTDVDHDAQEMVITSLRTQVQDLFSQVNQLNNKLVRSYDRVSDLEDSLHITTTNLQLSNQKISHLELEKSQHLSQLTSGLLVEKSHVTAELTRLMEQATQEAAQRGQAENAKEKIERELEELSASLFGEANGMVQEARMARSLSERKVEEAEGRLREAEEAVRGMQSQMQALMQEKEDVERKPGASTPNSTGNAFQENENLMKGHLAYQEYLAFLAHLRHLHLSNPNGVPPTMATLLQLPFLSRLLNEDAEPTLRLDLAPSLNWLSRRSILSAIHAGQLSVEPISAATLVTLSMESPLITIAGMVPSNLNVISANLDDLDINIPCALCGSFIVPNDTNNPSSISPTETHPASPNFSSVYISMPSHSTWSAAAGSFFRKPSNPLTRALSSTSTINGISTNGHFISPTNAVSSSSAVVPSTAQSIYPIRSKHTSFSAQITTQTQIHIFRLASLGSSTSAALSSFGLPLSKSSSQAIPPSMPNHSVSGSASSSRPASAASLASPATVASTATTFYPLCTSGWCLARLRATCTLWSFIRTGIVEKVWDEEVILPSPSSPASPARPVFSATPTTVPVLESSKRSIERGKAPPVPPRRRGLWGIASALGERAANWSEGVSKEKRNSRGIQLPPNEKITPSSKQNGSIKNMQNVHSDAASAKLSSPSPPPLPKRSANRSLPHRGENNFPAPPTQVESSNPPSTDSIDPIQPPPLRSNPSEKSAHTRNSSLSHAVNIPLPESRAGTPSLPVDVKINGISGHFTPTPSRTTSPAPQAAAGAPPPVPRRAAARNKGGIVGSPSDGTKVVKKDQLGDKTGDDVTKPVGVEVTPAKEETVAENREEKEVQGQTAKPASHTSEEIATDNKPVMAEEEKLAVGEVADEITDNIHCVSESGEGSDPTFGMNGIIKMVEEKKERLMEEPPMDKMSVPHAIQHEEQLSTEPSSATGNADEVIGKVDQTQYVGTSTWEEKTWRELVRIRKDMFYARIGAV